MERNPNDNLNSQSGSSSTGAGPESGYESGSSSASTSGGYGGTGGSRTAAARATARPRPTARRSGRPARPDRALRQLDFGSDSFADKAKDTLGDAKDKAKSGLSGAKDKATELKATLADKLEAGANKLRSQQTSTGAYAGATGSGSASVGADNGQLGQISDKLASGMQATADWLRDADMDQMKASIEKQVKEHPGRTLLIAVGLGYLLGKAFRK